MAIGVEPDVVSAGDRASRRSRKACNRAQDRRLAGAGRTDERDRLAADFER